jgi:hypothetical protein
MVSLLESAYMAIAFVVFVIVVVIGGNVLTSVQSTQLVSATVYNATLTCKEAFAAGIVSANCSTIASNATASGLTGITNLASQSGTIGTILGAVIIIGLLLGAFVMGRRE